MLSSKLIEFGDIQGKVFDFEFAGDVLGKHVHTEDDIHITIVTNGRIRAYSHDWSIEAKAGNIVDFRVGEPHEIEALEDGTRIVNILKKHGGTIRDDYEGDA